MSTIQRILAFITVAGLGSACQPTSVVDNEWNRDEPAPSPKKGLGSSPPRTDELKVGMVTVTEGGQAEITAPVPADRPEDPRFSERTVILMPEAVETQGHPHTRSACGEIHTATPSAPGLN